MFYLLFILPGLVVAYVLYIRPVLKAMPRLKAFYAEADGFWAKVWAISGKSLTIVWGAILTGAGTLWQSLDPLATALGAPDLQQKIMDVLKNHPAVIGYVLMGISAITIAARLRSIGKSAS